MKVGDQKSPSDVDVAKSEALSLDTTRFNRAVYAPILQLKVLLLRKLFPKLIAVYQMSC